MTPAASKDIIVGMRAFSGCGLRDGDRDGVRVDRQQAEEHADERGADELHDDCFQDDDLLKVVKTSSDVEEAG